MSFNVRLRLHKDNTEKSRVLEVTNLNVGHGENGIGTIDFTTTRARMKGLQAPFLVGVEYSIDGQQWHSPRNNLFIVEDDDGDNAKRTKVVSYTGQTLLSWWFARALLWWTHVPSPGTGDDALDPRKERELGGTPGAVLKKLIDEGKGNIPGGGSIPRGLFPPLTYTFTPTRDSNNVNWAAADTIPTERYALWQPYIRLFQGWTEQRYFDWYAQGTELVAVRPDTGLDLTKKVVLGTAGSTFTAAPYRSSFKDVFTQIVVVPEDGVGLEAQHRVNTGADNRFGAIETSMSMAGSNSWAQINRQIEPFLLAGKAKKEELAFTYRPSDTVKSPWAHYNIGDWVTARTASGKVQRRVVNITVTKQTSKVTVQVTVGDRINGLMARMAKKVAQGQTTGMVGGNGTPLPPPVKLPPDPAPAKPTGLAVTSNTAVWFDGQSLSVVDLGWNAVTTDVDGGPLDIATYELESTIDGSSWQPDTQTAVPTAVITGWLAEVPRYVRVRALSRTGKPGVWSDLLQVTPATVSGLVPKAPTGLQVDSNTGKFTPAGPQSTVTVKWVPVHQSTDNTPVSVVEYQVTVGEETYLVPGVSCTFIIPSGNPARNVTVRARTAAGVWGDPSTALSVTGAAPTVTALAPLTPTLTTGMSMVQVAWGGKFAGNVDPPQGFAAVAVESRWKTPADGSSPNWSPWERVTTPLTRAGSATIQSINDATVEARLVGFDVLGNVMGTSPVATINVIGADAPNFRAGAIEVVHVSPSFGDNLNLSANGSILMLVGITNDLETTLNQQQELLWEQNTAIQSAQDEADAANALAQYANTVASNAYLLAESADEKATQQATYYRFGPAGLEIGDPNSTEALRLKPGRIEMVQGGAVQSVWEGGVFIAAHAALDSAWLANHKVEKKGAGRTIIRPL